MDRLKPCPFCGSKDIKLCGNHRDSFWFRCNKCASIDSYDTERQAVRAWNKRAAILSAYKGMTNGEVIKTVFEVDEIQVTENTVIVRVKGSFCAKMQFLLDWWNSPYKGEQERSDKE